MTTRALVRNLTTAVAVLLTAGAATGVSQESRRAGILQEREQTAPRLVQVPAEPDSGFYHPYFLFVPEAMPVSAPILVVTPTPTTSTNAADYVGAAERIATNAVQLLRTLDLPVLVPVLPRPPLQLPDGHFIDLYLPALSRAALLAKEPEWARIDLQVLAMVDHARQSLIQGRGSKTDPRALFIGFSAGGHFATRMAVLHPTRVLAVWAGGTGGHPILPVPSASGRELTYPLGIADLPQVAGCSFDESAFARIPILIAQGSADTNASLPLTSAPSDSYSSDQARLALELLGTTAVERLEKARSFYSGAAPQARFRIYTGAPHRITPEIGRDLVEFVQQVRLRSVPGF